MNTYKIELKINMEIEAFNLEDAQEYVNDIFGVDEEVKGIHITSIKEK